MSTSKQDISVMKLINYNLIFFVPLVILYLLAFYFSETFSVYLEISKNITTQVIMMILSLVLFFVLIPFLRIRETIRGVRFSLFNFVIMGFVITLPSLLSGNYTILMSALIYLANFIFATFINSPDVIGISGDPEDWFKHKVQIMIFLIYVSIVVLYILGFAWVYFQMAHDVNYPNAFSYAGDESPGYGTFIYYSIVSMATVGYGDITPKSVGARLVMSLQILIGMIINVVFIAILLMYVSHTQTQVEQKIGRRIEREEEDILAEEKRLERMEREEQKRIKKIEKEEEKEDPYRRKRNFEMYRQQYPAYEKRNDEVI